MMQKTPEFADVALGRKIRLIRQQRGMSQDTLGKRTGVSFQQIQKYERGENRVGFSRLVKIARALECRVTDLTGSFDEAKADPVLSAMLCKLTAPGAIDLLTSYAAIHTTNQRRAVLDVAKQFAGTATDATANTTSLGGN